MEKSVWLTIRLPEATLTPSEMRSESFCCSLTHPRFMPARSR